VAPVVSVHIADVGVRSALRLLAARPRPGAIPGLRHADVGTAAPLSASILPSPTFGRVGFIGFWDDDAAVDRFVREDPLARRLRRGWHARLEPLRRFGAWPGLPDDLSTSRHTEYDGPAVVLTLGRLRLPRAVAFLRASARAEGAVLAAPGLRWATGFARPPTVATCSLWDSTRALVTYAYGARDPGHPDAIAADAADAARAFHHRSAFVRFRPYHVEGRLDGPNPLAEGALTAPGGAPTA
jgi:hypothetical protein